MLLLLLLLPLLPLLWLRLRLHLSTMQFLVLQHFLHRTQPSTVVYAFQASAAALAPLRRAKLRLALAKQCVVGLRAQRTAWPMTCTH